MSWERSRKGEPPRLCLSVDDPMYHFVSTDRMLMAVLDELELVNPELADELHEKAIQKLKELARLAEEGELP